MTKMLKATIRRTDGSEHTVRTYANESNVKPEQAFAFWLQNGATLISFEWIDTLTESRKQWNAEHPDLPIPLDL